MDSQEKPVNAQESLDIIHEMITRAKGNIQESAFYFLLWGWIIIAGSMGHYLLLTYSSVAHPELAWLIILIGIAASVVQGIRDRKTQGSSTYLTRIYTTVWVTFLINYFIILFFIAKINFYITPLVLVMAASSTYLSGSIIKFNPLKWGAVFIWLMAIASFLVVLPYQLLLTAAAVLIGYLVPGYILQNKGG
ncbi:MAG: hypothetical protein JXR26_06305 [Balneolaceae bacterium]|nr:hypothetical protein [Balneolaceae bacterium]